MEKELHCGNAHSNSVILVTSQQEQYLYKNNKDASTVDTSTLIRAFILTIYGSQFCQK